MSDSSQIEKFVVIGCFRIFADWPDEFCIKILEYLTPISISFIINRMRTTLDLPEELIEEARKLLGFKSKTDTVVLSLQELIRRKRIEKLKSLAGTIDLEIDIPVSRRRRTGR